MKVLETKSSELTDSLSKKYGTYNSFPDGWEEVTQKKEKVDTIFIQLLGNQWIATESRQMYSPGPGRYDAPMLAATLYFTSRENGFAISRTWTLDAGWVNRYYVFGCQHKKNDSKNIGSCYHKYVCKDCGYTWSIDSSG